MASAMKMKSARRTRDKLTEHLGPLTETTIPYPHAGWMQASREALGMSVIQLAGRLGVNRSGIGRLEESERTGAIRLGTLRRAAEAMDCTLVYAIVPNGGSYEEILNRQARASSAGMVEQTLHAMALENQTPTENAVERIRIQAADDLILRGEVWDL